MNKFFIIIILGLIISGCSASWHIRKAEQKCPECFAQKILVEYRDTTINIDTTFLIEFKDYLTIDTVPVITYEKEYIDKIVKILPTFDTIIKDERGLTAKIWMKKGNLQAKFSIDSSYIFHLQDSIIILNKIITQTNTVKTEKKPQFLTYLIWISAILILLFLIKIWKPK